MSVLKLEPDQVAQIAAAAIVQAMDQNSRERVIQQAVAYLLKPTEGSYGRAGLSPIQQAFNSAVQQAAQKIIADQINNDPEVQAKIKGLMADVMTKVFEDDREALVINLAAAFGRFITRSDRD